MIDEAVETLLKAGIANPRRLVNLIRDAISKLELDLSGLVVLTEAASAHYVVTPVIAALAGAESVLALTRDSQYASVEMVDTQTRALGMLCQLPEDKIKIYRERSLQLFAQADIVTNLGFVRPIDAEAVAAMKATAAVPLMCEDWEIRPGDVDLEACRRKGITVLGTNEDHSKVDVFAYSGWLCLKMLFDAQIEVHKSRITIVSSDKFGSTIQQQLKCCGVSADLVEDLRYAENRKKLAQCDVIVIADYSREANLIGSAGDIEVAEFLELAPAVTVLQFAGRIDAQGLLEGGTTVYPQSEIGAHRMALTLAGLGPRPVIDLHAAGLKIGEMAVRHRDNLSILPQSQQSLFRILS